MIEFCKDCEGPLGEGALIPPGDLCLACLKREQRRKQTPHPVKDFQVEIWVRFNCPECHTRLGFRGPRTNHASVLTRCTRCGAEYTIRDGITDLDIGVFRGDCREALEPYPQEINPVTGMPVIPLEAKLVEGPGGQGVMDASEATNKLN